MSLGDFSAQKELEILSHFAKITSITDLRKLLQVIIKETPALMDAEGCSIYLLPDIVPEYDGNLLDLISEPDPAEPGEIKEIYKDCRVETLDEDFIVLAATSRPNTSHLVGRAYYRENDGVSGWVFKHGHSVCIKNLRDPQELAEIDPDLHWLDRYHGSKDYYTSDVPVPILIEPLISGTRTIGILKVPAPISRKPFDENAPRIARIVAQILAGVINQTWLIQEQADTIQMLTQIGSRKKLSDVFIEVTERLREITGSENCQIYLRHGDCNQVRLWIENGKEISPDEPGVCYKMGEDFIGWVFKTGRPLTIKDKRLYSSGVKLDMAMLEEISDGLGVNEDDRYLKHIPRSPAPENIKEQLIAIPITDYDGAIEGVLCLERNGNRMTADLGDGFGTNQMLLASSAVSTISMAIDSDRQRQLGLLLTKLGFYWNPTELYKLVIENISRLVPGAECCIFELQQNFDGASLSLQSTNRPELLDELDNVKPLKYLMGEGKTGLCAQAETILVVSHYGNGLISRQLIDTEKATIEANHGEHDLVEYLLDENHNKVGLIQLRDGKQTSLEIRERFRILTKDMMIDSACGLPHSKRMFYNSIGAKPSWSYVAVPVKHEKSGLFGVITLRRRVKQTPFSRADIGLLGSIAGRLAAVLLSLKMLEQRESLLMTLAHEINTPLTGIIADSENLVSETASGSEIREISEHNLEQVQRLVMLTETILAVIPEKRPKRAFSIHNLHKVIVDACQPFQREAEEKGCDINPPEGTRYPDIEMSRLDLLIAFENIIHNAVKYSYRPPIGSDTHRYIKIGGRWVDDEHYNFQVSVQNFGVGISKEEIDKRLVFQPYYRGEKATDRRRTGAGFGLSHARKIIEDLHHGKIDVASRNIYGDAYLTTFSITLPIRQPPMK